MTTARPHTLTSNGVALTTTPERLGQLVSSDPGESVETLRTQFKAQGYVWLKGFFDREAVLAFREHFFAAFADLNLTAPGSDPKKGIYSGDAADIHQLNRRLMEVVRSAAYESFCLHPWLWQFYDRFLGGPSYLHKRKIIRYTLPQTTWATGAHYDLIFLRSGTDRVCSSWIPLGDTPVQMGGLVYLENSDALGRRLEAAFSELNRTLSREERISAYNKNMDKSWLTQDLGTLAETADSRWLVADYEAGDMVVHSAYMIHAATDNHDPAGRLRLSTDIRYQNVRGRNRRTVGEPLVVRRHALAPEHQRFRRR